tara:strand:- start:6652 stop:6810 length:159 start_codon:yes stop_codon:yes gene_type:complete
MKLWIKTPFPNEKAGEGDWHECTTRYEKRLWGKHNSKGWLPTKQQATKPEAD